MEEKSECETQEEANSLSLAQALTVPVPILVSRFRNKREVELVMEASKFAVTFDEVLEKYEMVSVKAQALKEAWDNLWVSQEPLLASAIPLIGEKMSEINSIRAHLLKKMNVIIESLQVVAKGLCQYAEINLSVAQELRMDGIERLAKDKLFLSELEEELAERINIICTKGSIHKLRLEYISGRFEESKCFHCWPYHLPRLAVHFGGRFDNLEGWLEFLGVVLHHLRLPRLESFVLTTFLPLELTFAIGVHFRGFRSIFLFGKMADFINSLIMKLELREQTMCDATTQNPGCNSLNKTTKTDQDMVPTINSSIQSHEQLMGNDSASTSASKAIHLQENNSGQCVMELAHGSALTTPVVGTCFASRGLAENDTNMEVHSHSSLVSEEQLSGIGSKFWLLQKKHST